MVHELFANFPRKDGDPLLRKGWQLPITVLQCKKATEDF